jgi:serine/threonine protein kinase
VEGTPFGHFELRTLLGRGGMGEVWRAYDTHTDRVVALKLLPANYADDELFQKRFRREARTAASLSDPHVIPIHGYGEIDGRLYVDMRLVEGQDLDKLLRAGPLPPARAVKIVEQVASALQSAHEVGLVHRDVKPSNILIGRSDFAYLIDFGIARVTGEAGLTSTGSTVGTWAYMAPERFSSEELDPRSDVYALACVLHQALTGRTPFPGTDAEKQVLGHVSTPPPQPSIVNPRVPRTFDGVIARGMAKQLDARYPTATALGEAATEALSGNPPRAERNTDVVTSRVLPPQKTFAPRQPVPPPTPTPPPTHTPPPMPTHVPPPPSPPSVQRFVTPPPSVPPAEAAPKKGRKPWIAAAAAAAVVCAVLAAVLIPWGGGDKGPAVDPPPPPSGPVFEGTFTASIAQQTTFAGKTLDGPLADEVTWVVRSSCDNGRDCVASARTVAKDGGDTKAVFDYRNGRWVAVYIRPETSCGASTVWVSITLRPTSGGKLVGDIDFANPDGQQCTSTGTVTFTRTGDPDPDVQTAATSSIGTREDSPGEGMTGLYQWTQTFAPGDVNQYQYRARTLCLRDGGRCLTVFHNDNHNENWLYADNTWTYRGSVDYACNDGATTQAALDSSLTLPADASDPINTVSGSGTATVTQTCPAVNKFDLLAERISA